MKKINKIMIIVLCALIMGLGSNLEKISASQNILHVDVPHGINSDVNSKWTVGMTQTGSSGFNYSVYSQLSINGQKVYCIDPLRNTIDGAGDYQASALGEYFGNADLTKKLGYISSLGYGFQGDTSQEMDYATQIRVWQEINPNLITNVHPEIQAKINLINERLNIMYTNVSFKGQTVILKGYGREFSQTLLDTTGTFHYYQNFNISGVHTERKGNTLTIWAEKGDQLNSTLTYDTFYIRNTNTTQLAYKSPTSQNVGLLGSPDPNFVTLDVKLELGSVQIHKEDFETGSTAQGNGILSGAVFHLIDNKTNSIVGTLTTDENLTSNVISDLATDRTYTIEEVSAPEGYTLNPDKAIVDFNSLIAENNFKKYTGTMKDNIITGNFEIHKIITDGENSEITETEKGAEFIAVLEKYVNQYGSVEEAYKHRSEFSKREYDKLVSDEDGYAKSKDLAYGTYLVKQIKGQVDTDVYEATWKFEVNQENQKTNKYIINNRPFTSYLKVVKLDSDSGKKITLSGMTFKIFNQDTGKYLTQKVGDEKKGQWTTNSKGYIVLDQQLKAGNYRLEEIKAPNGYLIGEDVEFTITNTIVSESDADGDPIKIIQMYDEQPRGNIEISKTDKDTAQPLENVEYVLTAKEDIIDMADGEVLHEKGSIVYAGATDASGKIIISDLFMGHYQLKETLTNEGYVLSEKIHDIVLKKTDETTKVYTVGIDVTNIAPTGEIHLIKTDEDTSELLSGVIFQLTASENIYSLDGRNTLLYEKGESVSVDISEDGMYMTNELGEIHIVGLPLGKYQMKEISALEGYYPNKKVYEIDLSYDHSDKTVYTEHLDITNKKTETVISKVDITKEEELEGASLTLFDENDEVVESWISTKEPHIIRGLDVGKEYRLHEDLAPIGYATTTDVTFIVDEEKATNVVMKDAITKVDISKVDATTQEELEGAKMGLTEKESGNVIVSWTSQKEAYRIEGLEVGKVYVLHEDLAPLGYELASDVEFTVEDTAEVQKVVMKDSKIIVQVETGDRSNKYPFLLSTISSLGVIVAFIYFKRKNKNCSK